MAKLPFSRVCTMAGVFLALIAVVTGLYFYIQLILDQTFSASRAQAITASELSQFVGVDKENAFYYYGSDNGYHYVHTMRGSYKVPREEMSIPDKFPLGRGEPYILTMGVFTLDKPPPLSE